MLARTLSLIAMICLSAYSAAACREGAANPRESPVETRRPVRGEDVRFVSGYGLRRHPLLGYERMHNGVDWSAPHGTPVYAAGTGHVLVAKAQDEYGNMVLIDHGGGWHTAYSQLASFNVREGDCVSADTLIGKVGSTGLSVGPHLHFEVRRDGQPLDPMIVQLKTRSPGREGQQ
jgi:murein DD-endopeptidase MepM/ murein hydrolase activator NlpD